ncbi:MAG: DUF4124 domain-containing protein, partial [Nitrospinae bacterium]|nr:DUF4124 domain-containing protein [Nitrospinota bacterium]
MEAAGYELSERIIMSGKFRTILRSVVALAVIFSFVSPSLATVYKWKGENGKMHFIDDPSKLPENQRSKEEATPSPVPKGKTRMAPEARDYQKSYRTQDESFKDMEEGFEKLGEALGKGLEAGLRKMGEELGKAFEGIGEWLVLAKENAPDMELKEFASKEEED